MSVEIDWMPALDWRFVRSYLHDARPETAPFRACQDRFLERHGASLEGTVVELGGQRADNNARLFPRASKYVLTNLSDARGAIDEVRDATHMPDVPTNSEDAYVLASVLEHIPKPAAAMAEIHRTLRPGGVLLATVPFIYPRHDQADYMRYLVEGMLEMLADFEIDAISQFGGVYACVACMLQRPRGSLAPRHLVKKLLGLMVAAAGVPFDQQDGTYIGIGIRVHKPRG